MAKPEPPLKSSDMFPKLKSLFWFAARIFIGFIYAYAGFSKLNEPYENFRGILAQYQLIPYAWTPVLAHVLPWVELIAGSLLIVGFLPRWNGLVLSLMSFSFVVVLGLTKIFSDYVPESCGCFGQGGIHLTLPQVMLLDFLNTCLGLKLFLMNEHPYSLEQWFRRRISR